MRILVLGSSGTIGSSVTKLFSKRGHDVIPWDIKISEDHDLRVPECLDKILETTDFVIFLAFDVGGAKYNVESYDYIDGNMLLLHNTFASLKKHKKPFIHSTSTMSNMNHNSYAVLKRLGELYTFMLGGINVKLWNVYGNEPVGLKSHVIPDFIDQALKFDKISIRSNGLEERMFLHCDDFSNALYSVFENYDDIDHNNIIDISSESWISILDIANIIRDIMGNLYNKDIEITTNNTCVDSHNKRNEPCLDVIQKYWKPSITIEQGITDMILLTK
jgi:nucleoside-diphosphate-sugar epimerase